MGKIWAGLAAVAVEGVVLAWLVGEHLVHWVASG